MRCGEAAMLQWTDFNFENKTVNITPEKGSEPRQLRISTQLISFESDDFHSATATTVQDAQKLVEAGFEYVCDFNETKLFRKRK